MTGATFSAMELVFHRDATELSKALTYLVPNVFDNFAYLLTDNLEYWKSYFPDCAMSISRKLSAVCGIEKDVETFRVCCFTGL